MFEDSTFESKGTIHTRSGGWMMATFALNGVILLALILIPLLYPEALPRLAESILMEAPPPVEEPKPQPAPAHAANTPPQIQDSGLHVPSVIPRRVFIETRPEASSPINVANLGGAGIGSSESPFPGSSSLPVVQEEPRTPAPISSGVMDGYLVFKATPVYPAIARAAQMQGTVVLAATISKSGSIENLRVIGGPAMLQQAALDAVRQWRYRPYRLNGQPVEVETTVNVVFKLNQPTRRGAGASKLARERAYRRQWSPS